MKILKNLRNDLVRLRNASIEKLGNLRNKPSTGKTPPFLIFRYWVYYHIAALCFGWFAFALYIITIRRKNASIFYKKINFQVSIRKVFGQKSISQRHDCIFRIFRILPSHHKLGIILENKSVLKIEVSKKCCIEKMCS